MCICVYISFDPLLSLSKSMCWWVWLLGVVTQSLCINTHYFQHPCVLKRFEIAFQCAVALGLQPAVFSIYSTCVAMESCTGNLCIISALLMLCLHRPLMSTTLWNMTPCFLSLLSLFNIPFLFLPPVSHYLLFSLAWHQSTFLQQQTLFFLSSQ